MQLTKLHSHADPFIHIVQFLCLAALLACIGCSRVGSYDLYLNDELKLLPKDKLALIEAECGRYPLLGYEVNRENWPLVYIEEIDGIDLKSRIKDLIEKDKPDLFYGPYSILIYVNPGHNTLVYPGMIQGRREIISTHYLPEGHRRGDYVVVKGGWEEHGIRVAGGPKINSKRYVKTEAGKTYRLSFSRQDVDYDILFDIKFEQTKVSEKARRTRIAELLNNAETSDSKAALKALYEALKLDPKNSTALKLKEKVQGDLVITNSIGMKLVYIPDGNFIMGTPELEAWGTHTGVYTTPIHEVKISKGFWLGQTEVTQGQYEAVMGTNPSYFKGINNPVEQVSWNDAMEFCKRLSEKEGKTYTLPTEAQWEYACRAGTETRFYFGDQIRYGLIYTDKWGVTDSFWHNENSGNSTHPVVQKKSSAWGLYDMYGNVCEWCLDWYDKDYYSVSPEVDPQGPSSGQHRVLRGGSYKISSMFAVPKFGSWVRDEDAPDHQDNSIGFRVVVIDF